MVIVKLSQDNACFAFIWRGEHRRNLVEVFLAMNPDLYPALCVLFNDRNFLAI